MSFVGLDNFRDMLRLGTFTQPLYLTIAYAIACAVAQNVAGLALALALERATALNGMFRTIFFLPVLLSPLVAAYAWRAMLQPDGPINAVVGVFAPDFNVNWLGISPLAIYLVAFIEAWKYFGFITLIYLAGLAGVPADLKEAALIDGANARQVFRHVKLPLLLPAMTVTLVLPLVGALNAFEVDPGDDTRWTRDCNVHAEHRDVSAVRKRTACILHGIDLRGNDARLCHGHSAYLVPATPTSGPVKRAFFRVDSRRSRYNAPRVKTGRLAMYAVLSAVAVAFFIVPIWIVVVGSWKPFGEAIEFSLSLPREWALTENYSEVLDKARYVTAFGNSLLVTSVSVAALLLIGSMAAWGFGRSTIALDGSPLLRDDHRHPPASRDRTDGLLDAIAPDRWNVLRGHLLHDRGPAWPWSSSS